MQLAHRLPRRPWHQQRGGDGGGTQPLRPKLFRFRHFDLWHGGPAFAMGTDAMLLGAWTQPPPAAAAGGRVPLVLDVGTGSGVLALMVAQKSQASGAAVHAIEPEPGAAALARANAAASPWARRLLVAHADLQGWAARAAGHSYDLIISNPPFFVASSKPPGSDGRRAAARHADVSLPFDQLAACAAALLSPAGRLCVVLPASEAPRFEREAAAAGLLLTRLLQVFTKSTDAQPKRHLLEFAPAAAGARARAAAAAVQPERIVVQLRRRAARGSGPGPGWEWSGDYRRLTADFHHPDLLALKAQVLVHRGSAASCARQPAPHARLLEHGQQSQQDVGD